MPAYVVTGVSKGLGFAILRQLSNDPNNIVVGLVRDKPATEKKVSEELGERSNIHILSADITNYEDLKSAAADTAAITGGSVDYLVANAAYVSNFDAFDPIGVLDENPKALEEDLRKSIDTNLIGNIHFYNLFMPLVLKGKAKKVIFISSGMADIDLINKFDLETGSLYSLSKAAMNVATAKFNAQYKKDGVLFLSISPGVVDVGKVDPAQLTPHQLAGLQSLFGKFAQYAPHFKGPATPEEATRDVINVWENASIEKGDGGAFVSHLGSKQWL
jgi:NAD(P)-dependent dehydrogenase (short-subunit alcohol dehydrogenase family)